LSRIKRESYHFKASSCRLSWKRENKENKLRRDYIKRSSIH